MSSNPRGTKRQREAARSDKRREKDAKRAQRQAAKASAAEQQPPFEKGAAAPSRS